MDIIKEIRPRLDDLNWKLLLILVERLQLVREVARQKQKQPGNQTIHAPDREAKIFDKMIDHCHVLGLNPDYVLEIVSLIIAHAKDAECDVLRVDTFLEKNPVSPEKLRSDLLELTSATAPEYSLDYCDGKGADAVRSYLRREKDLLIEGICTNKHNDIALDLGCATGNASELLQEHFKSVEGFDVCDQMVANACSNRRFTQNVSFRKHDLEAGIPSRDASVSFAVANFGAASEVSRNLLPELARVLQPGGKALLSFYNADAISNMWYYPWPSTLRAHLNKYNDTLEVWYKGRVYVVQGIGMTAARLNDACATLGLRVDRLESYPTFLSIVPRFFFSSTRYMNLIQAVTEVDESLAVHGPYRGTYLTAIVSKPE